MPIFEFVCEKCHHEFEELVLGSNPEVKCPKCHAKKVKKQLSVFGFKSGNTFVASGGPGCPSCSTPTKCNTCH